VHKLLTCLALRLKGMLGLATKLAKKPAGCSFHAEFGKPHFNTNLDDGVGQGKSGLAPICKVVSVWSDWGSWSDCSADCGGGLQTQYRTCLGGSCFGENSRTQSCNTHDCSSSTTCEYVAIPSNECPSGHLPTCVNTSPGSLCEVNLVQNGVKFEINNCGNSDVFRYVCTDTDSRDSSDDEEIGTGHSYTDMGFGLCKSAQGYSVKGLAHTSLTQDECKGYCDEKSNCVGYSGTNSARGTCYIHGPFDQYDKPDSTWFTSSGEMYEITQGNGLQSMQCFKRN